MNIIKTSLYFICVFLFPQAQANVISHFNQIKNNPEALYEFFKAMPKGGELHYHLAGGPYPETLLQIAATDNFCLNKKTFEASKGPSCHGLSTKTLSNDPTLYNETIKSWSMENFNSETESAHDHFFNTFNKFFPIVQDHRPELIANVIQRASNQHEHYLELMILPDNGTSMRFGSLLKKIPSYTKKRELLLKNKEFQLNIAQTATETERILKNAQQQLGCNKDLLNKNCDVTINFLYYSLREQSLDNLFAQTLNAFEAVVLSQSKEGHLVGVNLVQPEDGVISLRDYHQQMQIYQYMHKIYPQVNISLHAGELAPKLTDSKELKYHIHDALMTGQAQRIGHGVDIMHENKAKNTMEHMAKLHKAVEVNLISNRKILDVFANTHPLNYYLAHHVPVVLSTDDEGILRTDLTAQYVEAVIHHHLDYLTLKQINRNALTYAFVSGKSIWSDAEKAQLIPNCLNLNSKGCLEFIKNNKKALLQWNLEQKLLTFEKILINKENNLLIS